MNKSTPEYIRVREEIAKELFHQTYQFTLDSEVTKNKMNRIWAFHSCLGMKWAKETKTLGENLPTQS